MIADLFPLLHRKIWLPYCLFMDSAFQNILVKNNKFTFCENLYTLGVILYFSDYQSFLYLFFAFLIVLHMFSDLKSFGFLRSGIGIVNAIEVVNAFPEEDGLHTFRNWIESPDPTILGQLDTESASSTRKRGSSKLGKNDMNTKSSMDEVSPLEKSNCQDQEHKQSDDLTEDVKKIFMDKHVMKLTCFRSRFIISSLFFVYI